MTQPKEVLLSITGEQRMGRDKDKVELITNGYITEKNGEYIIDYDETIESGMAGTHTCICAGSNTVTITRTGSRNSQLLLEKDKRHLNHYDTGYGQLVMGINTSRIENNIKDSGELKVNYSIEMNHVLASCNSFFLKIKEVKNHDSKSSLPN